jgi:hypothetical protein
VIATESLPPVLLAVTVYVADEVIAVGVPEISPVVESRERPAGRVGDTVHEVTAPPLDVGMFAVIVVPTVSANGLPL